MQVNNKAYNSLWYDAVKQQVFIIDQTVLPHHFEIVELHCLADFCQAINDMQVRGAPLIGVTAAFALAMALRDDANIASEACTQLLATRPTAVNLRWALLRVQRSIQGLAPSLRANAALNEALAIHAQDIQCCEAIGNHGADLLQQQLAQRGADRTLNILTHCNAGWLAAVDWGTALAPIYKARERGLALHVWVDETRPRNQGSNLTAWELQQQGIDHTVIADNTGGHLMQQGLVDLCLVGSDRTTANGDVCNKIGTYLKALAAQANNIPFYVALPASTIDWSIDDGVRQIPIELRPARELTHITGLDAGGKRREVQLIHHSAVANYAFDVTPAKYISGLITEHGLFNADRDSLNRLRLSLTTDSEQQPIAGQQSC